MFNIRNDTRKSARAYNAAWGASEKAPLMLKKQKTVGTGKDKRPATVTKFGVTKVAPRRTNKCLRKHTLRVLLSSALYDAAETLEAENDLMGFESLGESARAPALYTISKGASMVFEHALIAYTQSVFQSAVQMVENAGYHSKVTQGSMKAAAAIVNNNLTKATSISPYVFNANAYKKTSKTSKGGDKEAAKAADAAAEEE